MLTFSQVSNSPDVPTPDWFPHNVPINLGTVGALLYSIFYLLLEPVAGGLIFPLIMSGTIYSNHLISSYPGTANQVAGGLFVASWIAQFVGHGKFEGRAPAVLDNLVQALVLAPFFVWMEVLFKLGYRPELRERVEKSVEIEVEKFRLEKERGKTNGVNGNGKAH
jgi:uncharacterized membrane protein YGL010W